MLNNQHIAIVKSTIPLLESAGQRLRLISIRECLLTILS